MFDRLSPAKPWHALQTSACDAPGMSSGPATAGPATTSTSSTSSRTVKTRIVIMSFRADGPLSFVCYPSMSCQMLLAHPIAFCAHASDWPGVSFCSIWTTLPASIL